MLFSETIKDENEVFEVVTLNSYGGVGQLLPPIVLHFRSSDFKDIYRKNNCNPPHIIDNEIKIQMTNKFTLD